MIQVAVRAWPAAAIHDTLAVVVRTPAFRRSLQSTLLERLVAWLSEGLAWLSDYLGGFPSVRTVILWVTGVLAALVALRVLLAARSRDGESGPGWSSGRARAGENPWRAAERLAAAGDHEGAAHALYRGVLQSIAERERLRLDPAKTSGDYVRELRARNSALHASFRTFARRFDAAVYGHGQIDARLVADLAHLAHPLRANARAA